MPLPVTRLFAEPQTRPRASVAARTQRNQVRLSDDAPSAGADAFTTSSRVSGRGRGRNVQDDPRVSCRGALVPLLRGLGKQIVE